jgi:hypothetical protein
VGLGVLWDWPQRLSRSVLEFAFHPAAYLHPDQAISRWAQAAPYLQGPVTSEHLIRDLGLPPLHDVDWSNAAFRAALLPGDVLMHWARLLGLLHQAPVLSKVVQRPHLQALSDLMPVEDWAWAIRLNATLSSSAALPSAPPASADADIQTMSSSIWSAGRAQLSLWMQGLPRALSMRVALKLPHEGEPSQPTSHGTPLKPALLQASYERLTHQWDSTWEEQWQLALRGEI